MLREKEENIEFEEECYYVEDIERKLFSKSNSFVKLQMPPVYTDYSQNLMGFTSRTIIDIFLTLVDMGYKFEVLLPSLGNSLLKRIEEEIFKLNPFYFSKLLWTLACLDCPCHLLSNSLRRNFFFIIEIRALEFTKKNIFKILWSLVHLGFQRTDLTMTCRNLLRRITDLAPKFRSYEVANLLWIISVLNIETSYAGAKCVDALVKKLKKFANFDFRDIQLHQLFVAHRLLEFKVEWPLVQRIWAYKKENYHVATFFEYQVYQVMKTIVPQGENLIEQRYVEAAKHYIDIAWEERRIAIEVEGPYHYFVDPDSPSGYSSFATTDVRDLLLKKAGWEVVSIPFFVWNRVEDRRKYLLNKLGLSNQLIFEKQGHRFNLFAHKGKTEEGIPRKFELN